jgi:hypothetical protein
MSTQNWSDLERAITDDVKFGAIAAINKALVSALASGTAPDNWSAEDKMKYFIILDVQDEILKRIDQTLAQHKIENPKEA